VMITSERWFRGGVHIVVAITFNYLYWIFKKSLKIDEKQINYLQYHNSIIFYQNSNYLLFNFIKLI
jgi:hypothetical protein